MERLSNSELWPELATTPAEEEPAEEPTAMSVCREHRTLQPDCRDCMFPGPAVPSKAMSAEDIPVGPASINSLVAGVWDHSDPSAGPTQRLSCRGCSVSFNSAGRLYCPACWKTGGPQNVIVAPGVSADPARGFVTREELADALWFALHEGPSPTVRDVLRRWEAEHADCAKCSKPLQSGRWTPAARRNVCLKCAASAE